jgi:hypothetical protein
VCDQIRFEERDFHTCIGERVRNARAGDATADDDDIRPHRAAQRWI